MHLRIPKIRLKFDFRHPVERQIFGDGDGLDPALILALCHKEKDDKDDISTKFIVIFIIDFEIFIHLLYDKLRGLPRRVFTLLTTCKFFIDNV